MKLALTVPMRPGETATSLASRLAARNFQNNVRSFCADMGLSFPAVVEGQPDAIDKLAALAGADAKALSKSSFVRVEGRRFLLNGEHIIASHLQRQRLMCCPTCMVHDMDGGVLDPAINAYGRAIWSIAPCRVCIAHGVVNVAFAPVPAPALTHDFANAVRQQQQVIRRLAGDPLLRQASDFERYLAGRIQGLRDKTGWLDSLDFSVAAKACEIFGAVAEFGRRANLNNLSGSQWAAAGATGFEILRSGVLGARDFLADLQKTEAFSGVAGPKRIFGRIYEWLAFHDNDPATDPLRDVVREHIFETMPVAAGEEVLGEISPHRRIHSIRTLSLQTGVHSLTVRKALEVIGQVPRDDPRQDNSVVFATEPAETLLTQMSEAMTQRKVRGYLNVNRVGAALLAGSGYLSPVLEADGLEPLYHPRELDRFLAELTAKARVVEQLCDGQVTMAEACKRSNSRLHEVVDLVLSGTLEWVGVLSSERGFISVLVELAEIKERVRLQSVEGITVSRIVRDLGVSGQGARYLIDTGALPTVTVINPANRCPMKVVPSPAYQRFKTEFVSLRDVARARGDPSRRLLHNFTRSGILPVPAWRANGAILFRRSDLP